MSTARTCENGQPLNSHNASPRPGEACSLCGVTPQPASSDLLRLQSELLPLILDNMGDGLVVADERGHLVFFNPAAQRILGIKVSDAPMGDFAHHYGMFHPVSGKP